MNATPAHTAPATPRRFAIIGAGMAGISCARTLRQAGHAVRVFEREAEVGGRMASLDSPFGSFDMGAQYFTVRDQRFERALQADPELQRGWSVSSVRTVDAQGERVGQTPTPQETHWVGHPRMQALVAHWAAPLVQANHLHTHTLVQRIERQGDKWTLHCSSAQPAAGTNGRDGRDGTDGTNGNTGEGSAADTPPANTAIAHSGFDAVICALPAAQTLALWQASSLQSPLSAALGNVQIRPCWTLLLAYPQAAQPGLITLGPQWNAARSTHPRIAWLARESSKPARGDIERWVVHAHPQWAQEHWGDSPQRVHDKLLRAFAETTGIHSQAAWSHVQRWPQAQTLHSLGRSYAWDNHQSLGACGDWCLGRRVEDAFVSGLELALALA